MGLDLFTYDFIANRHHYVAGALPRLPLLNGAVDIAVCANFLFAYGELLAAAETLAAIIELTRIARSQVLIHLIGHRYGSTVNYSEKVLPELGARGFHAEVWTARGRGLRTRKHCE